MIGRNNYQSFLKDDTVNLGLTGLPEASSMAFKVII